jgi:hypothetical protein
VREYGNGALPDMFAASDFFVPSREEVKALEAILERWP